MPGSVIMQEMDNERIRLNIEAHLELDTVSDEERRYLTDLLDEESGFNNLCNHLRATRKIFYYENENTRRLIIAREIDRFRESVRAEKKNSFEMSLASLSAVNPTRFHAGLSSKFKVDEKKLEQQRSMAKRDGLEQGQVDLAIKTMFANKPDTETYSLTLAGSPGQQREQLQSQLEALRKRTKPFGVCSIGFQNERGQGHLIAAIVDYDAKRVYVLDSAHRGTPIHILSQLRDSFKFEVIPNNVPWQNSRTTCGLHVLQNLREFREGSKPSDIKHGMVYPRDESDSALNNTLQYCFVAEEMQKQQRAQEKTEKQGASSPTLFSASSALASAAPAKQNVPGTPSASVRRVRLENPEEIEKKLQEYHHSLAKDVINRRSSPNQEDEENYEYLRNLRNHPANLRVVGMVSQRPLEFSYNESMSESEIAASYRSAFLHAFKASFLAIAPSGPVRAYDDNGQPTPEVNIPIVDSAVSSRPARLTGINPGSFSVKQSDDIEKKVDVAIKQLGKDGLRPDQMDFILKTMFAERKDVSVYAMVHDFKGGSRIAEQLAVNREMQPSGSHRRYEVFPLPFQTQGRHGGHEISVIADKDSKKLYLLDPANYDLKAAGVLSQLRDQYPGYEVATFSNTVQQRDEWSCSLRAILNMYAIIGLNLNVERLATLNHTEASMLEIQRNILRYYFTALREQGRTEEQVTQQFLEEQQARNMRMPGASVRAMAASGGSPLHRSQDAAEPQAPSDSLARANASSRQPGDKKI